MAAGGGGGGAGTKSNLGLQKNVNDANLYPWGQDASNTGRQGSEEENLGKGGKDGSGGYYGITKVRKTYLLNPQAPVAQKIAN